MSHWPLTDPVAGAFASALRDAYRAWREEHPDPETEPGEWGPDVRRLEVSAEYRPGGTGFIAVTVISSRPGRSAVQGFSLFSQSGKVRLCRKNA